MISTRSCRHTATHEYVVPKSIPIAGVLPFVAIFLFLAWTRSCNNQNENKVLYKFNFYWITFNMMNHCNAWLHNMMSFNFYWITFNNDCKLSFVFSYTTQPFEKTSCNASCSSRLHFFSKLLAVFYLEPFSLSEWLAVIKENINSSFIYIYIYSCCTLVLWTVS